ncbi:MAG TPA: alpha/beta hydrolase [Vicinamibacterales bacterium]|nr:alpha/beta hydrolase [Vicinamibacterales bacterium]
MRLVDVGRGIPIVLVPGIQGRWEWMKPAVDAMARHCRVITFSLADEPTAQGRFEPARGFDSYVDQIGDALDAAGLTSAVICGVSYGGLVASAFAARHPARVSALVLVSAIPPDWQPDSRVRFYLRAPWLFSPLFFIASLRLYREIAAASAGVLSGISMASRHAVNVVTHMLSPGRMARRVRLLDRVRPQREIANVRAPVLIITGDAELDRVVPVAATRRYLELWPHAKAVTLSRTGHLGLITRPDVFAGLVVGFAERAALPDRMRRQIG